MGVTVNDDLKAVKGDLAKQSLPQWIGLSGRLLLDERTRAEALAAGLLPAIIRLLESDPLDPIVFETTIWTVERFSYIDSLKKIVYTEGGYEKIASAFVRGDKGLQQVIAKQFRFLLTKGEEIRVALCKGNDKLFEAVIALAAENPPSAILLSGIIVMIASHFSDSEEGSKRAFEDDDERRNLALDCLLDVSSFREAQPSLLRLGIKEQLQPFIDNSDSDVHFVAVLIISLLSANDASPNASTGTNPTSPAVIRKIAEALHVMSYSTMVDYPTLSGYFVHCKVILKALRSLATNEDNLRQLVDHHFIAELKTLFQKRRDDLLLESSKTLEEAARVVWALSFYPECREQLDSCGIPQILQSYLECELEPDVKKALEGSLWNLGGMKRDKPLHVMISYSWHQKERMRDLAQCLRENGHKIWIDVEQMEGSVLEKMAEGVEDAAVMVIGVSATYKDSQACRTEAEYGYKQKTPMVFVVAEDGFVANGWLGAMQGDQLWYSPWTHKGGIQEGKAEFLKAVLKKAETSKPPQPQMHPQKHPASPSNRSYSEGFTPLTSHDTRYENVVVTTNHRMDLPAEEISPEKVRKWTVTDVCRWLNSKGLADLHKHFIWHDVDGSALWGLYSGSNTMKVLKTMGVDKAGLSLRLHHHLQELFKPATKPEPRPHVSTKRSPIFMLFLLGGVGLLLLRK